MSITINDLIRVLGSILGYELERSGDHVRYVLRVNGKIIARTKFSHSWRGNQQISEPILHAIAKYRIPQMCSYTILGLRPIENFKARKELVIRCTKQMHCSTKTLKMLLQGRLEKETYFRELLEGKVLDQSEFDMLLGKGGKNTDTKEKRTKDN